MKLRAFILAMLLPALAGAAPDIVRSVQDGPWSAAATWEDGGVPEAGDRVQVRTGHEVVYDAAIRAIHVAGMLRFATDRATGEATEAHQ